MGFGALRSIIRHVSRSLLLTQATSTPASLRIAAVYSPFPASKLHFRRDSGSIYWNLPFFARSSAFYTLTDTRYPKRRPSDKPRRKRAQLKPPGPYAWVKYVPGEPIAAKQPNEGSVKRRKEKKRIKQHRAFILAEKKKRKAQLQEAKRKKVIKRVELKMAVVARERAWAQRLVELQQIDEEKKAAMA